MLDTLLKNGTVIDGTGSEPFVADVGLRGGKIVAMGQISEAAKRTVDATGLHVLPGFIDIHTHYDGQASWDETFIPSIYHGVTTLVMGNCGVGFAPVRPTDHAVLIDLMEGVEEIPGSALAEGLKWNWETFTEYGRALDAQPHALDFMTLVPHDALRLYVMGERAAKGEPATAGDLVHMQALLRQALLDGACGLAIGSTDNHRTAKGLATPSFEVSSSELDALAAVFKDLPPSASYRVIQAVNDFAAQRGEPAAQKERFEREYQKIESMARVSGAPVSITWMDRLNAPLQAKWLGDSAKESAQGGLNIKLQTASRGIGILNGLDTSLNLLVAYPSYRALAHLPAKERAQRLREPETKVRILSELPVRLSVEGSAMPPLVDHVIANFEQVAFMLYPLQENAQGNMDYEPLPTSSFGAQAKLRGVSAKELMYDHLAAGDGTNLVYFPIFNYLKGSLDQVRDMLLHPQALFSLGDAGAHVGTICDASSSTTMLAHWGVQRAQSGKGEGLPLPLVVHMLTQRNALHMGLLDRGSIEIGKKADINLVNLTEMALPLPEIVRDLPMGGRRMVQKSRGYVTTLVAGEAVIENGQITAARPGRWTAPSATIEG
jgi:N-acyl-D-aspartate/D-glutamate deacylase